MPGIFDFNHINKNIDQNVDFENNSLIIHIQIDKFKVRFNYKKYEKIIVLIFAIS